MSPPIQRSTSAINNLYPAIQKGLTNWITHKKWCLSDIKLISRNPPPITSTASLERMNELLHGSGIFIRAINTPDSESTLLCPRFVPKQLNSFFVPNQKNCSASLWASGVKQIPYRSSPYLIFNKLSSHQVSKIADRDLLQEKSAKQYGPGFCKNLSEGQAKLAEQLREMGEDIMVTGPFQVFSKVNESIISYNQSDILGIGIPWVLNDREIENLNKVKTLMELKEKSPETYQFVGALLLADRLIEVSGRPVPVVTKKDNEFRSIDLPDSVLESIKQYELPTDYLAASTLAIKMSVKPAVAYSFCNYF